MQTLPDRPRSACQTLLVPAPRTAPSLARRELVAAVLVAETGAAQTTFLVIGAATMIAGGVGFRLLPRLVGGRGGAAA